MQQRSTLPANALLVSAIADVERAHPQAMARYGRAFLLVHRQPASDGDTGLVDKEQLTDHDAQLGKDAPPDEMYAIPLTPRSGAGAGRASGVITIGRLEHNDVFFGDDSVSKLHAIVRVHGGEYFIADAGSTLGTHVDGEPIGRMYEHAERRLVGGETVQLGNVTAMFVDTEGLLVVAGALQ
jgi:pSer/pThr/pTyr-binding forkhead associated (FHA) protein